MSLKSGTPRLLRSEDLDDLFEEVVARILDLSLFVPRIVAVLADEDDAVNGQFVAAEREGLGDGLAELHGRVAREALPAEVGLAHLVHVKRHKIHRGIMVRAVPAVAIEKTVDNVLRMRVLEVDGDDGGELQILIRLTLIFSSLNSPSPSIPAISMCSTWAVQEVAVFVGFRKRDGCHATRWRCASIIFRPVLSRATGSVPNNSVLGSQHELRLGTWTAVIGRFHGIDDVQDDFLSDDRQAARPMG